MTQIVNVHFKVIEGHNLVEYEKILWVSGIKYTGV